MRDNTVLHQEIAKLRAENEELRTALRTIVEELQPKDQVVNLTTLHRKAKLTVGEAKVLLLLMSGHTMSRAQILDGIGSDESECERNVDSHVKRIRKKLPWLTIETLYGLGYAMPPQSVAAVKAFLEQRQ